MKKKSLFVFQRVKQYLKNLSFLYKHLGQVQPSAWVEYPENITLGTNSVISYHARVYATPTSKVIIGRDTRIGLGAKILAFNARGEPNKNVTIGDNVFVGANAVILQGVRIHDNAVVGAGAIVTKDTIIGRNELWVGVPAKLKRSSSNG